MYSFDARRITLLGPNASMITHVSKIRFVEQRTFYFDRKIVVALIANDTGRQNCGCITH